MAVVPSAQSQSSLSSKPVPVETELPPLPFVHGVASGDPLPEAVVIWTRITPEENAMPGSGGGAPTAVRWRVALEEREVEGVVSSCGDAPKKGQAIVATGVEPVAE